MTTKREVAWIWRWAPMLSYSVNLGKVCHQGNRDCSRSAVFHENESTLPWCSIRSLSANAVNSFGLVPSKRCRRKQRPSPGPTPDQIGVTNTFSRNGVTAITSTRFEDPPAK